MKESSVFLKQKKLKQFTYSKYIIEYRVNLIGHNYLQSTTPKKIIF